MYLLLRNPTLCSTLDVRGRKSFKVNIKKSFFVACNEMQTVTDSGPNPEPAITGGSGVLLAKSVANVP